MIYFYQRSSLSICKHNLIKFIPFAILFVFISSQNFSIITEKLLKWQFCLIIVWKPLNVITDNVIDCFFLNNLTKKN